MTVRVMPFGQKTRTVTFLLSSIRRKLPVEGSVGFVLRRMGLLENQESSPWSERGGAAIEKDIQ